MENLSVITPISKMKIGENVTLKGDLTICNGLTKQKEHFYKLKIEDNTSVVYSNIFNNDVLYPSLKVLYEKHPVFYAKINCQVLSVVNEKKKYSEIKISKIEHVERYAIDGIVDKEYLKKELREAIKEIQHPGCCKLINNILSKKEILDKIFDAPGSEKVGYDFSGGLLAKIVRNIKLSKAICGVLNNFKLTDIDSSLNEDILVTASILSYLGKIFYLEIKEGSIIKTKEGKIFREEYLTSKILIVELEKIKDMFKENEIFILEQVITSCTGQLRYGALNSQTIKESYAFYCISFLDSKISEFEALERNGYVDFASLSGKDLFLDNFDK